jgi:hypothetical protein
MERRGGTTVMKPMKAMPLVLGLLVAAACGTAPGGTPLQGSPTPESQIQVIIDEDVTFGPGEFVLADPGEGLDALTSYRAMLTFSLQGTHDGEPMDQTETYEMRVSAAPVAREVSVRKGADPSADAFLGQEAAGMLYEKPASGQCTAAPADTAESLSARFEPASFLVPVVGAEAAGTETIGSAEALHYTFDQRALGEAGITDATGELWVAADGGPVLKYQLTATAGPEYLGEGSEGTMTWDYELTDANQPIEIVLPEDCPPGFLDAPQLADATNVQSEAGRLSYDTSASLEDATTFYTEQMPPLGWEAEGAPILSEKDGFMSFTRAAQRLNVLVSKQQNGDGLKVTLILTRAG